MSLERSDRGKFKEAVTLFVERLRLGRQQTSSEIVAATDRRKELLEAQIDAVLEKPAPSAEEYSTHDERIYLRTIENLIQLMGASRSEDNENFQTAPLTNPSDGSSIVLLKPVRSTATSLLNHPTILVTNGTTSEILDYDDYGGHFSLRTTGVLHLDTPDYHSFFTQSKRQRSLGRNVTEGVETFWSRISRAELQDCLKRTYNLYKTSQAV